MLMSRKLIGLFAVFASLTAFGAFQYQTTLTVGGYTGNGLINDFPLLVRIPASIASKCQADGKDLAFCSLNGAVAYPHEIDEWKPTGESLVWVKVPLQGNLQFVMKFGNSVLTETTERPADVWSDYTAVWHLNETVGAGSTDFYAYDSTANGLTLKAVAGDKKTNGDILNMQPEASPMGGTGRYLGTLDGWVNGNALVCDDTTPFNALGDTFAISCWMHEDAVHDQNMIFGRKDAPRSNNDGWLVGYNGGYIQFGKGYSMAVRKLNNNSGAWQYATFVYSGTTAIQYQNGVYKGEGTIPSAASATTYKFAIGANENGTGGHRFKGGFDEIRIYGSTPSEERVAAEYANMTVANYVTFGTVEEIAAGNTLIVAVDEGGEVFSFNPARGETAIEAGLKTCTATEGKVEVAPGHRMWVTGWELSVTDADGVKTTTSGIGTTCMFVHQEGAGDALTWKTAEEFLITVASNDGEKGSVSDGGWYAPGTPVTLTASPTGDNYFLGWTGDIGDADPEATTITIIANAAKSITATFIDRPILTVTATSADATKGTVTGGGQVQMGDSVRVIARAADGYVFAGWTGTGVPADYETSYYLDVPVMETMDLVANFVAKGATYTFVPAAKGSSNAYHWNNSTNWVGGVVPPNDGSANVVIDSPSAFTISFDGVVQVQALTFVGAGKMTQETWNGRYIKVGAGGITCAPGAAMPKFYSNGCLQLTASQKWVLSGTSDFSVSDLVGDAKKVVEIVGAVNAAITKNNFKGKVVTSVGQAPVIAGTGFDFFNYAFDTPEYVAGVRTSPLDYPNNDWNPGAVHGATVTTPITLDLSGDDSLNVPFTTYEYSVTNLFRFTGKFSGCLPQAPAYLNFEMKNGDNKLVQQYPILSRLIFDNDGRDLRGQGGRVSLTGVAIELANSNATFTASDIAGFDLGGCLDYRLTRSNWGPGRGNLSAVYLGNGVTIPGEIHLDPYRQWKSNGKADGQIGMLSPGEATFSGNVVCTNGFTVAGNVGNVGAGEMQVYATVGAKVNLTGDVIGAQESPLRILGGGEVVLAGDNAQMGGLAVQAGRVQLATDTAGGAAAISLGVTCPEVVDVRAFAPLADDKAFKTAGQVKRAFGGVELAEGDKIISGRTAGYYEFGGGTTRTLLASPEGNSRARVAEGHAFGGKSVFRYAADNCTYWLLESDTTEPEVAILAKNGATIANDIAVADNKSAGASTIGSADASTVTFAGDVTLAKDVWFEAAAGSTVNMTGDIVNEGGFCVGFSGTGSFNFANGLDVAGKTVTVSLLPTDVPEEGFVRHELARGLSGTPASIVLVTADGSEMPEGWNVSKIGTRLVFKNKVAGTMFIIQ